MLLLSNNATISFIEINVQPIELDLKISSFKKARVETRKGKTLDEEICKQKGFPGPVKLINPSNK